MNFKSLSRILSILLVLSLSILHSFDIFSFDTSKFVTSVAVFSMALNEVIEKLQINQGGIKNVEKERQKNRPGKH